MELCVAPRRSRVAPVSELIIAREYYRATHPSAVEAGVDGHRPCGNGEKIGALSSIWTWTGGAGWGRAGGGLISLRGLSGDPIFGAVFIFNFLTRSDLFVLALFPAAYFAFPCFDPRQHSLRLRHCAEYVSTCVFVPPIPPFLALFITTRIPSPSFPCPNSAINSLDTFSFLSLFIAVPHFLSLFGLHCIFQRYRISEARISSLPAKEEKNSTRHQRLKGAKPKRATRLPLRHFRQPTTRSHTGMGPDQEILGKRARQDRPNAYTRCF